MIIEKTVILIIVVMSLSFATNYVMTLVAKAHDLIMSYQPCFKIFKKVLEVLVEKFYLLAAFLYVEDGLV